MEKPLTNYINLLGRVVKDRVTHFEGTVTNLTFDLYGCVQAAVLPKIDKDGKFTDGRWLDVHRLEPLADVRTMPVPDFGSGLFPIENLGRWGRDRVSNFEGTISSIALLLSGVTEVALSPLIDKDGKLPEGKWFQSGRVELVGDDRRMKAPTFNQEQPTIGARPSEHTHGPADDKPPVR